MIKFKPNEKKTLEVVLFLAHAKPGMDIYRILKVLFLADKWHLNSYGRPIAGEQYVAMKYGPVPETAYKILRRQDQIRRRLGLTEFPFVVEKNVERKEVNVRAAREPNLESLSKSDIRALTEALDRYGGMGFNALKAVTHQHPAFLRAWRGRGDKQSCPMRYEDFLEGSNASPEAIEEIEYVASLART